MKGDRESAAGSDEGLSIGFLASNREEICGQGCGAMSDG
jgi:hypothetical protein